MAGGRGRAGGADLKDLWRELFGHASEACDMCVRVSVPAVGVVVWYVDVGAAEWAPHEATMVLPGVAHVVEALTDEAGVGKRRAPG